MIKKEVVDGGCLIPKRLASSKNHVALRMFDYCWVRDYKNVYKPLNLLQTFSVTTLVRSVTFAVGFSE